jgi:ketosteroid isomerase-like protein
MKVLREFKPCRGPRSWGAPVVGERISGRAPDPRRRTEETAAKGNPELVRDAYRLRLDGDRADDTARSISGFLELLAPDVKFLTANGIWPSCQGRHGVADLLLEAARQWAECSFAVEEVRELDQNRVFACGTVLARASGRTEIYEIPFVNLWTIETGRAIRIESFTDRQEAQAALDLNGVTPI